MELGLVAAWPSFWSYISAVWVQETVQLTVFEDLALELCVGAVSGCFCLLGPSHAVEEYVSLL